MHTADSLDALVADHIPESQVLEYKRALTLETRPERAELLKDLTGMGNGGGGTILFGVDEDDDGHGTADALTPLSDPTLEGRVENIVRAGVAPPLLYEIRKVEVTGGLVLEVAVEASPLGPYMVTSYPDTEGRYFKRHGTRVDQMSEQEIRDAYALALRASERRPALWADHGLPLIVGDGPQLCVAALPFEPLPELLDLRRVTTGEMRPQGELFTYIDNICNVGNALVAGRLWAHGFVGQSSDGNTHVRLHRDGGAGISQPLVESGRPTDVARVANAILSYLGWLWETFDLRRPVELRVSLENLDAFRLLVDQQGNGRAVVEAIGMPVHNAGVIRELEPWELASPSQRHRVVQLFVDSVMQAYGMPRAEVPFSQGHLYGSTGPLNIVLEPNLSMIRSLQRHQQLGRIEPSGAVFSSRSGAHVAHVDGGVIVDLEGNTLAVTEMGTVAGYPRDFIPAPRATAELYEPTTRSAATETPDLPPPPVPTGRWAGRDLETVLDNLDA